MKLNQVSGVVTELRKFIKFEEMERTEDKYSGRIRDWGQWENPVCCEEDEEDYDWKELSNSSWEKLDNITGEILKKYKKVEIKFQTCEKNYLEVYITPKKRNPRTQK